MNDVYWLTAKDVLRVNAGKWPNKIGAKDLYKSYTFRSGTTAPAGSPMPYHPWA